jgi:hypothetical protein
MDMGCSREKKDGNNGNYMLGFFFVIPAQAGTH